MKPYLFRHTIVWQQKPEVLELSAYKQKHRNTQILNLKWPQIKRKKIRGKEPITAPTYSRCLYWRYPYCSPLHKQGSQGSEVKSSAPVCTPRVAEQNHMFTTQHKNAKGKSLPTSIGEGKEGRKEKGKQKVKCTQTGVIHTVISAVSRWVHQGSWPTEQLHVLSYGEDTVKTLPNTRRCKLHTTENQPIVLENITQAKECQRPWQTGLYNGKVLSNLAFTSLILIGYGKKIM